MSPSDCRAEYRRIRARSHAESPADFDRAVRAELGPGEHAPEAWVRAARVARIPCRRCGASGRFTTGTVNGRPTGPGGPCYRCDGKGFQVDADARRNFGADHGAIVDAFRDMMRPAR